MKNRNFVFGFLLIALGSIWFLNNLNLIDFQIRYLVSGISDLWPLLLVVIGINLLLKNKTLEKFIWLIFLLLLVGYSVFIQYNGSIGNFSPNNTDSNQQYSPTIENGVTKGVVDLDVGGIEFDVTSGTDDFVTVNSNINRLNRESNKENNKQTVHIFNDVDSINFDDNLDYFLDLNLNENIPWDFEIDCGAIDGALNLGNIDVNDFKMDMGAGRIEVTLGNKSQDSQIDIESGVSEIIFNIPKESGLKVNFDGALNSTNLSELNLIQQDNTYISNNYEEASSKYDINVQMGLGKFDVNFY